ncbi:MAG: hypothetical protein ACOC7V_15570 [Spirochaetota bacterium]
MSTTTQPHETVSTDEPGAFTRRSWNYAYVGEDNEGRHHHVDRKLSRIVVTDSRAERDDHLGLGLNIVQAIAESVGGSVCAENRSDGRSGAVVRVSFPTTS